MPLKLCKVYEICVKSCVERRNQPAFAEGTASESGERGIRTLGPPKADNGFRDRPDRPLWHLS